MLSKRILAMLGYSLKMLEWRLHVLLARDVYLLALFSNKVFIRCGGGTGYFTEASLLVYYTLNYKDKVSEENEGYTIKGEFQVDLSDAKSNSIRKNW